MLYIEIMKASGIFTFRTLTAIAAAALCLSCTLPQTYHSAQHRTFSLGPDDLTQFGIAFITPSTVTGQEEEKQAVAMTFSEDTN